MAYYGDFNCKEDVFKEFDVNENVLENGKILLAWYGYGDYDGSAFVLFEIGDQLYEVDGSHCSCYGLEGQWDPEKTSVEALRRRIKDGNLGRESYYSDGVFDTALKNILTRWERKHC